jgi:hypothetical protein
MLSLEAIGVLAVLYALLVGGLVKVTLARKQAKSQQEVKEGAPVTR